MSFKAEKAAGKKGRPDTKNKKAMRRVMTLLLLVAFLMAFILSGCAAGQSPDQAAESSSSPPAVAEQPETDDPAQSTEPDKLDQYQTGAVPEGKPQPVEPNKADVDKKIELHCTLTVSAETILDNMDKLDPAKNEVLPADGVLLSQQEVIFYEGENVYDVLLRAVKENKIHMESTSVPVYNSKYIEGIGNLYEYDCGELSGWMYKVNGWFPNYGCSRYQIKDGDQIEWLYTCDLGRDIGGDWEAQNRQE